MRTKNLIMVVLAAMICVESRSQGANEVFIPMDYSTCGYHASEIPVPVVRNVAVVKPGEGDRYADIQSAIDYVSAQKPDADGHRGAVLLGEGTFYIGKALRIETSGVVLRGMGKQLTRIVKTGVDRGAAIYIEGRKDIVHGDSIDITGDVKAGATVLTLARPLPKGDAGRRIMVCRPSTKEWIDALGMDDFGGKLSYTGWKPSEIDLVWHRNVVSADGLTITIDAPVTCSIEERYGGGKVLTGYNKGEITECGVEQLTLVSAYESRNAGDDGDRPGRDDMDEDHCWTGVWIDNAADCWVSAAAFLHFAGSAVSINRQTRRITVEDCIADEPVSETGGGWRRNVFFTRGEQTLFQRCYSRHGIHDFAVGFCSPGPNAFVQCEAREALGFSGSIGSWSPGVLFDIVDIDGNDIKFANLEQFQFGTGWNTANSMAWQCTASTIYCYSPDEANRNSANGCWGCLTGNAEWAGSNKHVSPRSLFYSQLSERIGDDAPEGYILPRDLAASSSPSLEDAARMAQLSLTEPRLTLDAWIDTVIAMKQGSAGEVYHDVKKAATVAADDKYIVDETTAGGGTFAIDGGRITFDGKMITGGRYHVTWWNGRVKDNFLEHGAKPAITRFVPGREGTGLTDRIDSVVTFLKNGRYCMLDHNYGLWYDLRRTDHERIRRADGDVWPPFYEQPFARTGIGRAWDGLSLYDLTKPDKWYWSRLREYAVKGARAGLLLFHQNYFQHNILEAGAHWVDCPWRPVNNVNATTFPEPVPFTGDKRIFMAEQFYNVDDSVLRPLHKQYIRRCLSNFTDCGNVVQLIGEEYTGPLHFLRFWLETIAEWEQETAQRPLVALSCTKDAQDSVLADPVLGSVVDIIDIRYWHYNTDSLWAPPAGKNLSPRQFQRRMKPGKTSFAEVYRAVREYSEAYPDKAVTYYGQAYAEHGWAVLMAGGSLPNVKIDSDKLLIDINRMRPLDAEGCFVIGDAATGYVVYSQDSDNVVSIAPGTYNVYTVDERSGNVDLKEKAVPTDGSYSTGRGICWLETVARK